MSRSDSHMLWIYHSNNITKTFESKIHVLKVIHSLRTCFTPFSFNKLPATLMSCPSQMFLRFSFKKQKEILMMISSKYCFLFIELFALDFFTKMGITIYCGSNRSANGIQTCKL